MTRWIMYAKVTMDATGIDYTHNANTAVCRESQTRTHAICSCSTLSFTRFQESLFNMTLKKTEVLAIFSFIPMAAV